MSWPRPPASNASVARPPRPSLTAIVAVLLAACKLTEVTVAPGERRVAVQSVINRSQAQQLAVVEYTVNGDTNVRSGGTIPGGRPGLPVGGASVTIAHHGPGSCTGRVDTLRERGATTSSSGTYMGTLCGLDPGDRLQLRVVARDGNVVTGETVIPGVAARQIAAGGRTARFAMDTLPFSRERDTLKIGVTARHGSALQVEVRRTSDHEDVAFFLFTDTLGLAIPANLVNPFEGDSGSTSFHAGRYYLVTVALTDANYFDYVRSLSDPITGRGFLNHLEGGIGVFGSMDVEFYVLRVVDKTDDPREGIYRITGQAGTTNVDLSLELYVDHLSRTEFSGFVQGVQVNGPVTASGDGRFTDPNTFVFGFDVVRTTAPQFRHYAFRGVRTTDRSPFLVDYTVTSNTGATVQRATLTARQEPGAKP